MKSNKSNIYKVKFNKLHHTIINEKDNACESMRLAHTCETGFQLFEHVS